jgi:acyl dehydratase
MLPEYFEDAEVGATAAFGNRTVTAEEIRTFARQYDPQPFHLDEAAARESPFGGLIASGWHTCALTMRMLVDNALEESGAVGAAGVDELRWPNPLRPGDSFSVEAEIVGTEPFRPTTGLVLVASVTSTDDGDPVMRMTGRILFPRRERADSGE